MDDMENSGDPVRSILERLLAWSGDDVEAYYQELAAKFMPHDESTSPSDLSPTATFASLPDWARAIRDMDAIKQELAVELLLVLGNAAFNAWLSGSHAATVADAAKAAGKAADGADGANAADERNRARLHEFVNGMTALIQPALSTADGRRRAAQARESIVKQLRSSLAGVPAGSARLRMYSASSIWDAIDQADASTQSESCQKSLEAMSECRAAKLSTLRALRARVEQALSFEILDSGEVEGRLEKVSLHENRDHLFAARTYKAMSGDLKAFMALTPDRKRERARLLLKLFESKALIEMWNRCIEMIDSANTITAALKKKPKPSLDPDGRLMRLEVIVALENLEWACARTWQQQFDHDDEMDRYRWLHVDQKQSGGAGDPPATGTPPPNPHPSPATGTPPPNPHPPATGAPPPHPHPPGSARPAQPPAARPEIQSGQHEDSVRFPEEATNLAVDDVLPDEPEVRAAVTSAQRAVIASRVEVRKAYSELRKALAEASTTSVPQTNLAGMFVSDCVQPRLQAVMASVGAAIRGYLSSRYEPDGGETAMLLRRAEQSRSSEIYRSRLPSIDLLRLRLSDNGAKLMIAIKAFRFFVQLGALWAAQRAYVEAYQASVLSVPRASGSLTDELRPSEPPDLSLVLCVFLGIDAMGQLIVLLFLVVFAQLFGSSTKGSFVIDDDFLADFLADYFITTVAIGALGMLTAQLFKRKRYFDLANQGLVTARAYCVVLAGASGVAGLLMPAFLL